MLPARRAAAGLAAAGPVARAPRPVLPAGRPRPVLPTGRPRPVLPTGRPRPPPPAADGLPSLPGLPAPGAGGAAAMRAAHLRPRGRRHRGLLQPALEAGLAPGLDRRLRPGGSAGGCRPSPPLLHAPAAGRRVAGQLLAEPLTQRLEAGHVAGRALRWTALARLAARGDPEPAAAAARSLDRRGDQALDAPPRVQVLPRPDARVSQKGNIHDHSSHSLSYIFACYITSLLICFHSVDTLFLLRYFFSRFFQ